MAALKVDTVRRSRSMRESHDFDGGGAGAFYSPTASMTGSPFAPTGQSEHERCIAEQLGCRVTLIEAGFARGLIHAKSV